jgi:hypothetical protein
VEQASACLHLNFAALAKFKPKQAEQAAEKVGRFVGRGFSHDVSALDSSEVLTPEARKCHFSAACEACLHLNFAALAKFTPKQAEQAAERVGRFVGRGFSHDVSELDSSGGFNP